MSRRFELIAPCHFGMEAVLKKEMFPFFGIATEPGLHITIPFCFSAFQIWVCP